MRSRREIRLLRKERNALVVIKKDISVETRSIQRVTQLAERAVLLAISELNVSELDCQRGGGGSRSRENKGSKGAAGGRKNTGRRRGGDRGRRGRCRGRSQETNLVTDGNHNEEPTRPVQHSPEFAFTVEQLTGH